MNTVDRVNYFSSIELLNKMFMKEKVGFDKRTIIHDDSEPGYLKHDKPKAIVASIFYDGKEFYRDSDNKDFVYATQFERDGKLYNDETRISFGMVDKLLDSGEADIAMTYKFNMVDFGSTKEAEGPVVAHAPINEVYEVISSNSKKLYFRDPNNLKMFVSEKGDSKYTESDINTFLDKGTMYVQTTYSDKLKDLERCLDFLDTVEVDYIDNCTEYSTEMQKTMTWLVS